MMSLIARETQSSELELVGSSQLQSLQQDSGLGRATGYLETGSVSPLCLAPWGSHQLLEYQVVEHQKDKVH